LISRLKHNPIVTFSFIKSIVTYVLRSTRAEKLGVLESFFEFLISLTLTMKSVLFCFGDSVC